MGHTVLGPAAFWEGFEAELTTLAIYAVGLALYTLFVGTFYRTLSRRNLLSERKEMMRTPGPLRFLVMFPIVSFAFFLLLSAALFFLIKAPEEGGTNVADQVQGILTTSMAIVAGVRVAAYISHNASEDLAKLLPLGLLGVLIVDSGFLNANAPVARFQALPEHRDLVVVFLLALVVLEVALRIGWVASGGPGRAAKRAELERSRARLAERRHMPNQQAATPGGMVGPGVVAPATNRPPIPKGKGRGKAPEPAWLETDE